MKCHTDRYERDNYHSPSGIAVLVLSFGYYPQMYSLHYFYNQVASIIYEKYVQEVG